MNVSNATAVLARINKTAYLTGNAISLGIKRGQIRRLTIDSDQSCYWVADRACFTPCEITILRELPIPAKSESTVSPSSSTE